MPSENVYRYFWGNCPLVIQIVCACAWTFVVLLSVQDYNNRTTMLEMSRKNVLSDKPRRYLKADLMASNITIMPSSDLAGDIDHSLELKKLNIIQSRNGSKEDNSANSTLNLKSIKDKFAMWIPKPEQTNMALTEHPFQIANENICKGDQTINLVILIHSATGNIMKRHGIRQTWGNTRLLRKDKIQIVFILGSPGNSKQQTDIEMENDEFHDIVQGLFMDTYHNLTHKAILGLRWLTEYCENAKYVIKIDDDVFVNTYKLRPTIGNFMKFPNFLICQRHDINTSIIQRMEGKWIVNQHEFTNFTYFPLPYCVGFFIAMDKTIATRLYRAAKSVPFFWIDDFYVYGMLADKIGLKNQMYNLVEELSLHTIESLNCFAKTDKHCELLVGNAPSFELMKAMWEKLQLQYRKLGKPLAVPILL